MHSLPLAVSLLLGPRAQCVAGPCWSRYAQVCLIWGFSILLTKMCRWLTVFLLFLETNIIYVTIYLTQNLSEKNLLHHCLSFLEPNKYL